MSNAQRIVFLDSDYRCHVANDGTMTAVKVEFFNDKCVAFIEGYRYVPFGETWTRSDGVVFQGAMLAPWKNYDILAAYQEQYEAMLEEQADMQTALETLGVNVNG